MTAFYTAAGGDRRRLPAAASGSAGAAQGFRRAPRVGPPPVLSAGAAPVPVPVPVPEAPRPARVGRPVSQQKPSCPPPVRRDPVRHGILWSPELMDWLYQCRSSGVAVAVLARALGCTTQTVFTQFRRDPRGDSRGTAAGAAGQADQSARVCPLGPGPGGGYARRSAGPRGVPQAVSAGRAADPAVSAPPDRPSAGSGR